MAGCSREKCPGSGLWIPVFLLRKKGADKSLRAKLREISVCEFHKDHSSLNDFLSDEGWNKLEKYLREVGKGQFSRNLTQLAWEPVPGSEGEVECLPF